MRFSIWPLKSSPGVSLVEPTSRDSLRLGSERTNRPTPRRAVHRPLSIRRLTTLEMVLGEAWKRLARVRTEGRRLEAGYDPTSMSCRITR